MAIPGLPNSRYSESDYGFEDEAGREEFYAGERMCAPRARRSTTSMLFAWVIIGAASYGGWTVFKDPPPWLSQLTADVASLSSALSTTTQPQQPNAATAATPPTAPQPLEQSEVAEAPAVEGTPVPVPADDTSKIETASLENEPSPPQPAPKIALTDPYQKKAEAAGLSPDVSLVLLKKMSDADYKNAAAAIKTALIQTPDDGILTYPPQKKPGFAHFKVHFVEGAAETCRRYVVTVTKDRWETTAPAMEKCGIKPAAAASAKSAAMQWSSIAVVRSYLIPSCTRPRDVRDSC